MKIGDKVRFVKLPEIMIGDHCFCELDKDGRVKDYDSKVLDELAKNYVGKIATVTDVLSTVEDDDYLVVEVMFDDGRKAYFTEETIELAS